MVILSLQVKWTSTNVLPERKPPAPAPTCLFAASSLREVFLFSLLCTLHMSDPSFPHWWIHALVQTALVPHSTAVFLDIHFIQQCLSSPGITENQEATLSGFFYLPLKTPQTFPTCFCLAFNAGSLPYVWGEPSKEKSLGFLFLCFLLRKRFEIQSESQVCFELCSTFNVLWKFGFN